MSLDRAKVQTGLRGFKGFGVNCEDRGCEQGRGRVLVLRLKLKEHELGFA